MKSMLFFLCFFLSSKNHLKTKQVGQVMLILEDERADFDWVGEGVRGETPSQAMRNILYRLAGQATNISSQKDEQTDRQMDRQTDGWTIRQCIYKQNMEVALTLQIQSCERGSECQMITLLKIILRLITLLKLSNGYWRAICQTRTNLKNWLILDCFGIPSPFVSLCGIFQYPFLINTFLSQ